MSRRIFIISDLHLGGEAGFQMITPQGRQRLARFVREITALHRLGHPVHLVLSGDIVDFLAEEPFAAFTADDTVAASKLDHIFARTAEFWDALSAHLRAGGALTLLTGNHDLELSLPTPRRHLLERLGPGRVEFLYDNQALPIGPLLIEHGNRYDSWNMVNHDELRQVRSALSRRQPPPLLSVQPGSEMVIKVVNPLKAKYSFIDLLKPEDSAVPPFLAVLEPSTMATLRRLFEAARLGAESRQKWSDEDGMASGEAAGKGRGALQEVRSVFSYVARELNMYDLASAMTNTEDVEDVEEAAPKPSVMEHMKREASATEQDLTPALSFAQLWSLARAGDKHRTALLRRLRKALLARAEDEAQAFRLDYESPAYLDPARQSARRGFQVVVYGHTHLVRRVHFQGDDVKAGALYLNTGTWADLMRVPDAILRPDTPEDQAMEELCAFADDLAQNRLDRWRHHRPTFARIDLGDDLRVESADVYLYTDSGREPGGGEHIPDGDIVW